MRFLIFTGRVFLIIVVAKFFVFIFPFVAQLIHPTLHEGLMFYSMLAIGIAGGRWTMGATWGGSGRIS